MYELAEQAPTIQKSEINHELRIRTDTNTWLAETLHGSMRTSFEYAYDGHELRGEDGGSIDAIFEEAIAEAKEMTKWNPSLLFELRRRLIEHQELGDMHKMISGELPNTMVVLSDFPPELMDAKEDLGGYNISRKQTMMRVITHGKDGKLRITSQSLDGSNREALEAISAYLGHKPKDGELLGQRAYLDLPEEEQDGLADRLTGVYDSSMAEQHGGEWHAGISQHPDRNIVNTYDFVLSQQELVDLYVAEVMANSTSAGKLRYNLAATMSARHARYLKAERSNPTIPGKISYTSVISGDKVAAGRGLTYELHREGMRAARSGKVFSGCGVSETASQDDTGLATGDQLSNSGYGNKSSKKSGEVVMKCVNCPKCRTFHDEVRKEDDGYIHCKNKKCGYKAKTG